MEDFYLTLPSNSSGDIFSNNTQSEYRTKLSSQRILEGQWEVALCEIRYPCTWYNIPRDHLWFQFKGAEEQELQRYTISNRYYHSIEELIEAIQKALSVPFPAVMFDHENPKKLLYKTGHFLFSDRLSEVLGVAPGVETKPGQVSRYEFDVNIHHHTIYLYGDFVEPQLLGDAAVPLLRTIPVQGTYGHMVAYSPRHLAYIPVINQDLHYPLIYLRDEEGKPIEFTSGIVYVLLHFRRRV